LSNIILGPIIGGLSHERVNLWARADQSSTLYAWLATHQHAGAAKLVGRKQLVASNGFAGMVAIKGLSPAKKYFFALTLDPKLAPPRSAFRPFSTFPTPRQAKSFRFAFGSCFLPCKENPGLTFKHINENQNDLAFMLMLGDQIYADEVETNGLGHAPANINDYRKVYKTVWSNPYHRELLARTPSFMILDDHEVDNDWRWNDRALKVPGTSWLTRFTRLLSGRPKGEQHLSLTRTLAGLMANWEHQAMHSPMQMPPNGPLAYEFEFGAAAFFVLDTRTQRFLNKDERQLLGDKQWRMLESWLKRVKKTYPVKFIVSSISILSDMVGDLTADRWAGFDAERERLFALLAQEEIEGIHFLVGDLHSAHSFSANLLCQNGREIPIWEYCSSPFEQKPFRIAWLLDHPAKSPALREQKRHFTISEINYGVIEVDFSRKKFPRVDFKINYEKKGKWYTK